MRRNVFLLYFVLFVSSSWAVVAAERRTIKLSLGAEAQSAFTGRRFAKVLDVPRGGGWFVPAGWNPFGYKITTLGDEFLSYDGSLDCDVGRFLASLKNRKRFSDIKSNWLEIVRVAKTGQAMRIYKNLQDMIQLCLKAGLID
jgi:hypothetical protein